MGQAKRRGSFEDRYNQSINKMQARKEQENTAYKHMTEEQWELTEKRVRARMKSMRILTGFLGASLYDPSIVGDFIKSNRI